MLLLHIIATVAFISVVALSLNAVSSILFAPRERNAGADETREADRTPV
jgi:hypothetical protein